MRPKTLKGKTETFRRLTRYLNGNSLNTTTARGYMSHLYEKKWQISSINSEFRHIRAFISWCYEQNFIKNNWGKAIKLPKQHRQEIQIVPFEVAKQIINAGCEVKIGDNKLVKERKKEARDCLIFILKTGLRNFEARELLSSDFNLEEKTFWVTSKGGNRDKLPLPTDIIGMLRPRVSKKGKIFLVGEGRLQDAMALGCKKLNISQKIRVHSLRHIYATTLLRDGTPYGQARRLMRHKDTRVLDTVYSHLNIDDLSIAINSSSMVSQGLTPREKLSRIIQLLQNEIKNDKRFIVSTKTDSTKSLSFKIKVKPSV